MDFSQLLAVGGLMTAVITAVSVIVQVVLNKKLRTPADKAAEFTVIFDVYKEGIADSRADREALEKTTQSLREYVDKLEKNSREDFSLRVELEDRIHELETRIREKNDRINHLERELSTYQQRATTDIETQ